jgi:hypothetical protein
MHCRAEVIDVRDAFTGATFPVEADPKTMKGFFLVPAKDARMNPNAYMAELYLPHIPNCSGAQNGDAPDPGTGYQDPPEEGTECTEPAAPEEEEPTEPAGVASDPVTDDPPTLGVPSTELSEGPE